MKRSGGVSEAIVIVTLAIALFAVFFGAFLVVPLVVVGVGLVALAISQRSGEQHAAEAHETPRDKVRATAKSESEKTEN